MSDQPSRHHGATGVAGPARPSTIAFAPAARPRRRGSPGLAACAVSAVLALVSACGGGGGGSGTALSGTDSTTSSASAWAEGTVSGFGSIIVNGVRYDDSTASVVDDDGLATKVALGARVELTSSSVTTVSDDSSTAVAGSITVRSQLTGPVASVDTASFVALGQTVDVTEATVFDSTLASGLSSLVAGSTVVRVHGLVDSVTGHLLATRVESVTAATAYALRGTVSALDTTATTFNLGGATIVYGSATNIPTTLADGQSVRVVLSTTADSAGRWVATAFGKAARSTTAATDARVRGTVTAYTSATSFAVNGITVDASAVTSLPSTLAVGVEVEVRGTLANGVLVASAVTLKSEARGSGSQAKERYELHGTISALDVTAQTFVVRGVTVSYGSVTSWLPSGASAASLVDGVKVTVKGALGSDRSTLTATTVRIRS